MKATRIEPVDKEEFTKFRNEAMRILKTIEVKFRNKAVDKVKVHSHLLTLLQFFLLWHKNGNKGIN